MSADPARNADITNKVYLIDKTDICRNAGTTGIINRQPGLQKSSNQSQSANLSVIE